MTRFDGSRIPLVAGIVRAAGLAGLDDGTEYLLETANRTVPIEEHTLEGSGTATTDMALMQGAVAYDTPYAARQHEDTRLNHDQGRRAKWLERTLDEEKDSIRAHIVGKLKAALL